MDNFLTARQVQDILKVDRITIYRMLNDGRLKGNKIGQQWRFLRTDVEDLLGGEKLREEPGEGGLPVHCLQTIQDLFATVSQLSALLIDPQGNPITEISNPCSFCQLLYANPLTAEICQTSRVHFVEQIQNDRQHFTCHAGLHYAGTHITSNNEVVGILLAGGYHRKDDQPHTRRYDENLEDILIGSNRSIETTYLEAPVLLHEEEEKLDTWTMATAQALESILRERSVFASRLKKIADLTQIP